MNQWSGKVAIVTGASSGIGAGIAQRLVEQGLIVVGMARRDHLIDELAEKLKNAPGKLYAQKVDLTSEESIKNAFEWTTRTLGPVSLLVNDAAAILETSLIDGDATKWKTVLDTNIWGTCVCTREAISIMRDNNIDGHIVFINDCGGHTIFFQPGINVYGCTKFALTNLIEFWRQELLLIDSKIRVAGISPGVTKTQGMDHFDTNKVDIGWFSNVPTLKPSDLADAVEFIITRPGHCQVYDITVKPIGQDW